MNKEIESVINKLPMEKSTDSYGCTDEFYQIFKEKLTLILLKLFTKIEENISKLNLQCQHYPTSKTDTSNEIQRLIFLINIDAKFPNRILVNQSVLKGWYTMIKWDSSLGHDDRSKYANLINLINHINEMKDKYHL